MEVCEYLVMEVMHMDSIYAVEFLNQQGEREISRYFETLRAARSWIKWLRAQRFVASARIMRGGPGGEEVAS